MPAVELWRFRRCGTNVACGGKTYIYAKTKVKSFDKIFFQNRKTSVLKQALSADGRNGKLSLCGRKIRRLLRKSLNRTAEKPISRIEKGFITPWYGLFRSMKKALSQRLKMSFAWWLSVNLWPTDTCAKSPKLAYLRPKVRLLGFTGAMTSWRCIFIHFSICGLYKYTTSIISVGWEIKKPKKIL